MRSLGSIADRIGANANGGPTASANGRNPNNRGMEFFGRVDFARGATANSLMKLREDSDRGQKVGDQ